ncbi:cold-shock protein [Curtobacterium sp. Leaf183]|uniref:cold-shock protein n=1 Tax=Curtobacterium sp. Leaf183 TaxID=1736291 RepID=UPI0009E80256|nr:cold shock domain-containing protein [Curtobacterium sp. Leaf183]
MSEPGVVCSWNADEGWGVIDVANVDGGVWAHFSTIEGRSFGVLNVGESVFVEWDDVKHGSCSAQATRVLVDGNEGPVDVQAGSGVLNSILTIKWDADQKD